MDTRTTLKTYFETGDKPTQGQFSDLIESTLNIKDDGGSIKYFYGQTGNISFVGSTSPGCNSYNLLFNPLLNSIDFTDNTTIKEFISTITNDSVLSLNFTGNTSLELIYLLIPGSLSTVILTGCTALKTLFIDFSGITSITDLHNCTALTHFQVSQGPLGDTDLTFATNLLYANCNSCNSMTSFDVHNLPIEFLNLSQNSSLTSLNITGCTSLKHLDLNSCTSLNSPDFSDLTALYYLDASASGFTVCDLSTCFLLNEIHFGGCNNLTSLLISDNGITFLDCIDCALDQSSIDNILAQIDNNDNVNGYLDLHLGTNSAPTNGALNTNYLSLLSKGWTVSINP